MPILWFFHLASEISWSDLKSLGETQDCLNANLLPDSWPTSVKLVIKQYLFLEISCLLSYLVEITHQVQNQRRNTGLYAGPTAIEALMLKDNLYIFGPEYAVDL